MSVLATVDATLTIIVHAPQKVILERIVMILLVLVSLWESMFAKTMEHVRVQVAVNVHQSGEENDVNFKSVSMYSRPILRTYVQVMVIAPLSIIVHVIRAGKKKIVP